MKIWCKLFGHKSSFVWWMSGVAEAIACGILTVDTFGRQYKIHKNGNRCMNCGGDLPKDLANSGIKIQLSTLAKTWKDDDFTGGAKLPKRFLISS